MLDLPQEIYIFVPTIFFFIISRILIKFCSSKRAVSRLIVISILIFLTIRYLLWRSFYTLNLTTTASSIISYLLLGLEIIAWLFPNIEMILAINIKNRNREADQMQLAVINQKYNPSIDILIPTVNESIDILKKTIVACQALDYDNKKIYLLDDGKREDIKKLATLLNCNYITRKEHKYAKAGNLNNAINLTNGDLIVVFDADFIPTTNFLTRTVGFFQKENVALLQTQQHFYNHDIISKNLGLDRFFSNLTDDFFSKRTQPVKDYYNSAMCYGSSFLVRREYLKKIGGFDTDTICEDFFTCTRLLAQKYQTIFLNERLSAGLVPENIPSLFNQRMRWAQGTIQGFFIQGNPLTLKGLTVMQRLHCFLIMTGWFLNFITLLFFTILPFSLIFGIIPFQFSLAQWIDYFLPLYIFHFSIFFWLNDNCASKLIIDFYSFILTFPVCVAIIKTLINPFEKRFKVTPKGVSNKRLIFHWKLAFPLILIWLFTVFSTIICLQFLFNFNQELPLISLFNQSDYSVGVVLFWNTYYLIIIGLAILAFIDFPQSDSAFWLNIRKKINLSFQDKNFSSYSTLISEKGIIVELNNYPELSLLKNNSTVELEFMGDNFKLEGNVINIDFKKEIVRLKIDFVLRNLNEYRQLIKIIFCTPNRWEERKPPGEIKSFLLLLKALFKPKFLSFLFD